MINTILPEIEITDEDIDEVETLMGEVRFDAQRRNILKSMDSVDIQAFPGTGKTTVLIAKLAILAKKWPYANRGICILSHTNVARDEIEKRLGNTAEGKKLLSYPHFIGTFHSFFDTFIGIPWLRSSGYPITLIDSEITLNRRYRRLDQKTKYFLTQRTLSERACQSISFPIALDLPCGETTDVHKDVMCCVKRSFQEGYFTFDELLYISKYVLDKCGYLSKAIQFRFPILFVDEAQDTSQIQWDILNACFSDPKKVLKKAFGDANQAIYQSYTETGEDSIFPSENYLPIANSLRFGKSISHLADPLGIKVQGFTGELTGYDRLSKKHSIILFDDPAKVLPTYADILLSCFCDEELKGDLPCYAIGMVHSKVSQGPSDKKYPVGIKDYWPPYNPEASKMTYKPQTFIEFFRIGHRQFNQTGDYSVLVNSIAEGFRKYIRLYKEYVPSSGAAFNCLLKLIMQPFTDVFRSDFLKLICLPIDTEENWAAVVGLTKDLLYRYFEINESASPYFGWLDPSEDINTESHTRTGRNIYTYVCKDTGRSVDINLSSIHGVKGRTHLSTLVLDTFWYKRNMEVILPWLEGVSPTNADSKTLTRLKCHYVGLTRARALICIAIPRKSVSLEDKNRLASHGWNILEV